MGFSKKRRHLCQVPEGAAYHGVEGAAKGPGGHIGERGNNENASRH